MYFLELILGFLAKSSTILTNKNVFRDMDQILKKPLSLYAHACTH